VLEILQDGSNMTGTDLCVNKPHMSRSYMNHLGQFFPFLHVQKETVSPLNLVYYTYILPVVTQLNHQSVANISFI